MCEQEQPEVVPVVDYVEALLLNTEEIHNLRYEMCIVKKLLERIAHRLEQ